MCLGVRWRIVQFVHEVKTSITVAFITVITGNKHHLYHCPVKVASHRPYLAQKQLPSEN